MGPCTGAETKASTMKEHNHGKFFILIVVGFVETNREIEFFVEKTVFEGYGVIFYCWNLKFEVV